MIQKTLHIWDFLLKGFKKIEHRSCSLLFWLMAFITMVEPSLMVRTNMRETKPKAQVKLASTCFEAGPFSTEENEKQTESPNKNLAQFWRTGLVLHFISLYIIWLLHVIYTIIVEPWVSERK